LSQKIAKEFGQIGILKHCILIHGGHLKSEKFVTDDKNFIRTCTPTARLNPKISPEQIQNGLKQ